MPTSTRHLFSLTAVMTAAIAAGCSDDATDTIPDGAYRADITVDELVDAGVPGPTAEANGGVQILTIEEDTFEFLVRGSGSCHGTLAYEADQVTFVHGPPLTCPPDEAGVELLSAAWELAGDDLTLDVLDVCGEPQCPTSFDPLMGLLFGSKPFVRVEE